VSFTFGPIHAILTIFWGGILPNAIREEGLPTISGMPAGRRTVIPFVLSSNQNLKDKSNSSGKAF
jgi:hypothetical protein